MNSDTRSRDPVPVMRIAALACLLLVLGGPGLGSRGAAGPVRSVARLPAAVVVSYAPPVPAPIDVVRGFEAPSSPYGPGHRGVDLATTPGEPIRAAGDGVVRFAGAVAGRGVVVLAHADGITTEYEPIRPTVHVGDPVARGHPIGQLDGTHGACAPNRCVHWGAKRAGAYFDPLSLLRPLGPVRLLPWSPAEDP